MAQVIWTESALGDLEAIVRYIARDSPGYAERVGEEIVTAPQRLRDFPRMGCIVPEFRHEAIREILCGSYRILYVVEGQTCSIIAIIHASRDITRHVKPGDWVLE